MRSYPIEAWPAKQFEELTNLGYGGTALCVRANTGDPEGRILSQLLWGTRDEEKHYLHQSPSGLLAWDMKKSNYEHCLVLGIASGSICRWKVPCRRCNEGKKEESCVS